MRSTPIVFGVLLVALALAPSAGSTTTSGLRGTVSLSPAFPVCIEGEPCTKPARGVLLAFHRNGRVAARVITTQAATYRVALSPGRYAVSAPRMRLGAGVTPASVRVIRGRFVRVDLEIDTGIQ